MTPKEINQLNIAEFLASLNVFPQRKFGGYWMYNTPWKDQRTGSLKVDLNKGLWIDFSSYEGGTLIDLVLKIYPTLSVKDIVRKFNQGDFSFHPLNVSICSKEDRPCTQILKKERVTEHPKLCDYLKKERGIDPNVASKYIAAYQYQDDNQNYWNLGARNHTGGYNLFSRGFKRATKQGYTLYENTDCNSRIYFEGIIDFLSFLMIYRDQECLHEYCILNTVSNLKKASDTLKMKAKTIGFLDNDKAGDKATRILKIKAEVARSIFYDYRKTYTGFKDLNDFLIGNK